MADAPQASAVRTIFFVIPDIGSRLEMCSLPEAVGLVLVYEDWLSL